MGAFGLAPRGAFFALTRGRIAPTLARMDKFHADVIRKVGGRSFLAAALGVPSETVKSWPKRGIPARYWHRVVELAQDPALTIDDLDRTKPQQTKVAA
jgi:hypothetical protein